MWSDCLVFCDCGFHSVCSLTEKDKRLMEAFWWERLTEGETGSCPWVSRSLWWRHGLVVACCMVGGTECSSACMWPFEGGCHYLHHLHHSLASGQITGREISPTHQQKIGLKIYWAWPCPSEQDLSSSWGPDPWFPSSHLCLGEWSHHRDYLGHEDFFLHCSSVYSCHLFLISSASVRSIPFLSFIVPISQLFMKCPLGISNFLEAISSLSHSIVSLYFFALITEDAFLCLLAFP